MKKIALISIGLLFSLSFQVSRAGSDWVQDGGSLNVNPGENAKYATISCFNATPYVTWSEFNDIANQVYVKHYNGNSWVQDGGSLNMNADQHANFPYISISNGTPYVAWSEVDGVISKIYVKHYNGVSWVQDGGSLNMSAAQSAYVCEIAVFNGTPYVSWQESNGTANQIYVKHYNGSAWIQDNGSLNVNTGQSASGPRMDISNGTPYVTWWEFSGVVQIYVKHFTGTSWVQDGGGLNVNVSQSARYSDIAISNGTPYVTWKEYNGFTDQIYVKHYNGSGWEQDGGSLNINTNQYVYYPAIAASDSPPYVAWREQLGAMFQIYVKHYNGSGWEQAGGSLNVNAAQSAYSPSIVISNGTPYATWHESNGDADQIYVKHYVAFMPTVTPTSIATPTSIVTPTPDPEVAPLFKIAHALVRVSRGESAKMLVNLTRSGQVRLQIYDLTGRRITTLWDGSLGAGSHEILWDGANAGSGTYFVYFEAEGQKASGKLVLVR